MTLVALSLARAQSGPRKAWALFEAIENRFARQVRWSIPLAGATGLWMVWRMELWQRCADASFWWMHAMVLVWALFMTTVFVAEPLAYRRLASLAASDPAALLRRLSRTHSILLAAASITIIAAVAHGGLLQ